jgi:hypothetical protein
VPEMCAQCAFRKSCETWHEPRNHLVSQICAAGPVPFLCHADLDWHDPFTRHFSARALMQAGGRVCEGWRRQVAARRWPVDPDLRRYQRMLAHQALFTAERFLEGEASARELQRDLSPLAEYYHGPRAWQVARMVGP